MTAPQQPESAWQPTASEPAQPRKSRRKLILAVCGAVFLLCCGSSAVIAAFAPPKPHSAANSSPSKPQPSASTPAIPTSTPASPVVTPTTAPASPTAAATTAPAPVTQAASYGFLQTVAWWDKTFPKLPTGDCAAAGENPPVGTQHAWQLPHGGLACVDEGPNAWSDHITAVDIFFPAAVGEEQAVAVATTLLPSDATNAGKFDGVNPGYSAKPNGSCRQVVYTSATVRTVVTGLNPTWTGDPSKATLVLYSGKATSENGAELPYNPGRVHLAVLMINGELRGADGTIGC